VTSPLGQGFKSPSPRKGFAEALETLRRKEQKLFLNIVNLTRAYSAHIYSPLLSRLKKGKDGL
jgi:hypothetical protein